MNVSIRKKVYCLLEPADIRNKFDVFMMTAIVFSIIPLAFKEQMMIFEVKRGVSAFLLYSITPFALPAGIITAF